MRIQYLLPTISRLAGGLFEIGRQLARHSAAMDCKIQVAAIRDPFSDDDLGCWSPIVPVLLDHMGPKQLGYSPQFLVQLEKFDTDVAHVHGIWMYPAAAAYRWKKRTNHPYLISTHGMLDPWALSISRWKKRIATLLYDGAAQRGAACLHVNTESERIAVRRYGLKNPVCVIPNGVEILSNNLLHRPGSFSNLKVLLYLGRLHPKKGLKNLLQGWAALQSQEPTRSRDWMLAIAGWDQNGHEAELQTAIRDLGISNSAKLVGPLYGEEKAAAYQHCSGFVMPSFSEGLPMVVLEAWSYGHPVVMTPECNLETGFNRGAAIKILTNPDAIKDGILQLFLMSDADRRAMGEKGRQLVQTSFTWPKVTAELREVYEWALDGGSPPPCVRLD